MEDLVCPVFKQAGLHPESVAIELVNQRISYLELNGLVDSTIKKLRQQGVRPGQIIATLADNSLDLVVLAAACWRCGFIWAPFNPRWHSRDIEQQLQILSPHWIWPVHPGEIFLVHCSAQPLNFALASDLQINLAATEATEGPDPERVIDLIQTSGSSGSAKFVAHCLRNHLLSAQASSQIVALDRNDAWLLSLPLYHIAGVAILFRCFSAAARVVLVNSGELWLDPVCQGRVTHLSLVNAQLFDLLATVPSDHLCFWGQCRLKAVLLGGSAINADLLGRALELGLHCYSSYGMTETSSQIYTVDHRQSGMAKQHQLNQVSPAGSDDSKQFSEPSGEPPGEAPGQFLNCAEVRLDAHQQIMIRGDCVALGYWQAGKVCDFRDREGWFATGDAGQLRAGCLDITGRLNNIFICNGENLQPEQIEQTLSCHPAVRSALVVAIDEPRAGKTPVAFVDWNHPPDQMFESWLDQNIGGLQRPRLLLPWQYIVTKNSKADRQACTRIAEQFVSGNLPDLSTGGPTDY